MLEIFPHQDFQAINGLLRRRREAGMGLAKLNREFERVSADVRATGDVLNSLTTAYAVAQRELRDTKNEIFSLRRKCAGIDDGSLMLQRQLEKNKEALSTLIANKRRVETDIAKIRDNTREIRSSLHVLQKERDTLAAECLDRNELKQKIAEVLEQALVHTSFKREEIEAEIANLNERLMEGITVRTGVTKRLSETKASAKRLRESVSTLQAEKKTLEQIKILRNKGTSHKSAIQDLREKIGTMEKKAGDMEETIDEIDDLFDALSSENRVLDQEIRTLEADLLPFDNALKAFNAALRAKNNLDEQTEQSKNRLAGLFTEPVRIITAKRAAEKMMAAIADVLN